jgi:hypothetical protein
MPITAEVPQDQRVQHAKDAVRRVLQVATPEELGRLGLDQTRIRALGEGLQAFMVGTLGVDEKDFVTYRQGSNSVYVRTHRIGETDEGLAPYQGREVVIIRTGISFGGFELRIVPVLKNEALTQEIFTGDPAHEKHGESDGRVATNAINTEIDREMVDSAAEPGEDIKVGLRTFMKNTYASEKGAQVMEVVYDVLYYPIGRVPDSIGDQGANPSGMVFIHDWRFDNSRRVIGCYPARSNQSSQGSGNHIIS